MMQDPQTAKQQGISTHAYVQPQTGWILRAELYYPPEDRSNEQRFYIGEALATHCFNY
jgi:hypothetical protein